MACPACGTLHAAGERLCPVCGLPLVVGRDAAALPVGDLHERARKIRREYAEGPLVRVAGGRQQAEAEFVAGLLLEEGIPSLIRRSAGFDVPDYLAAGPRDILVPASGAEAARDVLLQTDLAPSGPAPSPRAWPVLAALLAGLVVIVALTLLVDRL